MAINCCKNIEIERIKLPSIEYFNLNYLTEGRPVVIEDSVTNWNAHRWTLDSLKHIAGHNKVHIRSKTNCIDYKQGRQYLVRESTFEEYLCDIETENKRSFNSYLAVQNIKKALPELQNDIEVPEYVGKMHGGPYLWIAPAGHYEYCHFDPDDGFLVVIKGSKQARLFGCDPVPMYPNQLGSKGRTIQSQVDCDNPDLLKHPMFTNVTCYHAHLKEGDMLYIPAFWWHQITTPEMTISVNMFWGDKGDNIYLTKVINTRWEAFSYWLLNIIEQNQSYDNFSKTLARLPESLNNFLLSQWHEIASDVQINSLIEIIKSYLQIESLPDDKSSGKYPPRLQIRGLLWRK